MIIVAISLAAPPDGCPVSAELLHQLEDLPEASIHWDLRKGPVREVPTTKGGWVLCRRKRLTLEESSVVASFGGELLAAPALTAIPPDVGDALGRFQGERLLLDGVASVPASLPRRWNDTSRGGERVLSLGGLNSLDLDVARWLGHPATLRLVVGLAEPTPSLMGSFHNRELVYPRLTSLSLTLAESLQTDAHVEMPALRQLAPDVAAAAKPGSWTVGLPSVSADLLENVQCRLQLPDVTSIDAETAEHLKGNILGITSLSAEAAARLPVTDLTLPRLATLSLETAKALVDNPNLRTLELTGLTSLDDEVAMELQRSKPKRGADWVTLSKDVEIGPSHLALLVRYSGIDLTGRRLRSDTLEAVDSKTIRNLKLPRDVDLTPLHAFDGGLSAIGTPAGIASLTAESLTLHIEQGDDPTTLDATSPPLTLEFADDRVITVEEATWMQTRKIKEIVFQAPPSLEAAKLLQYQRHRTDLPLGHIAEGKKVSFQEGPRCDPQNSGPKEFGWHDHTGGRAGLPGRHNAPWVQCGLKHLDLATAQRLSGYPSVILPDLETADEAAWDLLVQPRGGVVVFWDDLMPTKLALLKRPKNGELAVYGLKNLTPEQARQVPPDVGLIFEAGFDVAMADALPYGSKIFVEEPLETEVLQRVYDRHIEERQLEIFKEKLRPRRPGEVPEGAVWLSSTDPIQQVRKLGNHSLKVHILDDVHELELMANTFRIPWPVDRPRHDAGGEPIDVQMGTSEPVWSESGNILLQLHTVRLGGDRSSAWATLQMIDPKTGVVIGTAPLVVGGELAIGEERPRIQQEKGAPFVELRDHRFYLQSRPHCFQGLCVETTADGTRIVAIEYVFQAVPLERRKGNF